MRKIFIVIERRADYSRYKPILELLRADSFFKLFIVVTGINLLPHHGEDIKKIRQDGFHINTEIPMFKHKADDSGAEMVRAMSRFMLKVVDELEKAKPDIVLTGFDIGANFATAVAAAHMNIPVAHIQGGEVTGSIDESLRHAMSKFAHIHFPATQEAKKRLIAMGERPSMIHVVGCPSLDELLHARHIPRTQLEEQFRVDFDKPTVILIQHPVTTEDKVSLKQIKATIAALKALKVQTIAILPNNDAGFSQIVKSLSHSNLKWYPSIDVETFANLYRHIWAIVGNSSSGIHEATTFHTPAVNIGTRQNGRTQNPNVINVSYDKKEILRGIKKALFDQKFRSSLKSIKNIYGNGHSATKIVKILKTVRLFHIVQKEFYD